MVEKEVHEAMMKSCSWDNRETADHLESPKVPIDGMFCSRYVEWLQCDAGLQRQYAHGSEAQTKV